MTANRAFGWRGGAIAQFRLEKDITYGMQSGFELLMDVHHPTKVRLPACQSYI